MKSNRAILYNEFTGIHRNRFNTYTAGFSSAYWQSDDRYTILAPFAMQEMLTRGFVWGTNKREFNSQGAGPEEGYIPLKALQWKATPEGLVPEKFFDPDYCERVALTRQQTNVAKRVNRQNSYLLEPVVRRFDRRLRDLQRPHLEKHLTYQVSETGHDLKEGLISVEFGYQRELVPFDELGAKRSHDGVDRVVDINIEQFRKAEKALDEILVNLRWDVASEGWTEMVTFPCKSNLQSRVVS